jgi:hypothetical protein
LRVGNDMSLLHEFDSGRVDLCHHGLGYDLCISKCVSNYCMMLNIQLVMNA